MAKNKSKKNLPGKELSEGKAIMIAVLAVTAGLIGAVYLIRLIIGFFFPGLMN